MRGGKMSMMQLAMDGMPVRQGRKIMIFGVVSNFFGNAASFLPTVCVYVFRLTEPVSAYEKVLFPNMDGRIRLMAGGLQ